MVTSTLITIYTSLHGTSVRTPTPHPRKRDNKTCDQFHLPQARKTDYADTELAMGLKLRSKSNPSADRNGETIIFISYTAVKTHTHKTRSLPCEHTHTHHGTQHCKNRHTQHTIWVFRNRNRLNTQVLLFNNIFHFKLLNVTKTWLPG